MARPYSVQSIVAKLAINFATDSPSIEVTRYRILRRGLPVLMMAPDGASIALTFTDGPFTDDLVEALNQVREKKDAVLREHSGDA